MSGSPSSLKSWIFSGKLFGSTGSPVTRTACRTFCDMTRVMASLLVFWVLVRDLPEADPSGEGTPTEVNRDARDLRLDLEKRRAFAAHDLICVAVRMQNETRLASSPLGRIQR